MKICSITSTWWVFFDLLSCYSYIPLNVTNFPWVLCQLYFDVSIKEKRVYASLCFELLPQQMSQSKKKYMDLCIHTNKYKQVVLETISWMLNGIQGVTYVTWTVK